MSAWDRSPNYVRVARDNFFHGAGRKTNDLWEFHAGRGREVVLRNSKAFVSSGETGLCGRVCGIIGVAVKIPGLPLSNPPQGQPPLLD